MQIRARQRIDSDRAGQEQDDDTDEQRGGTYLRKFAGYFSRPIEEFVH